MSRKIIGVTVGTPVSASKIGDELKPVKTVNNKAPDANGNVNVEVGGGGDKVTGMGITAIIRMTQKEYDAMESHDAETLYVIVG